MCCSRWRDNRSFRAEPTGERRHGPSGRGLPAYGGRPSPFCCSLYKRMTWLLFFSILILLHSLYNIVDLEIGLQVLVASTRQGEDNQIALVEPDLVEGSYRMGRFQGRNDPFVSGECKTCPQCFVVVDGNHLCPSGFSQMGVDGTDTRIVQSCRDGIGFGDLPVFGLHHQCFASMDDPFGADLDGGGRLSAVDPLAARFGQHDLHSLLSKEVVDGSGGVAASRSE